MSIDLAIMKLRELPPEKQREVLNLIETLYEQAPKPPRRSLEGLWADLGPPVTAEEIAEARREM